MTNLISVPHRRPTTPRAPSWLRQLTDTRTLYEELFGLPVSMNVSARRVVLLVGNKVDAVAMPSSLARRVLAELRIAMLAGPVIAGPGNLRWTFLTSRAEQVRELVQAELRGSKVQLIPRGARVVVPPSLDGADGWRWVEVPKLRSPLPPWAAVVATARRALDPIESVTGPQWSVS